MMLIYDKRDGSILCTIENNIEIEKLQLLEFQGFLTTNEKISDIRYLYIDSNNLLKSKNYIELSEENGILKINSSSKEEIFVSLLIENSNGFNPVQINFNGYKELPINNESKLYTKISIFDSKNYSNILELNKAETIDITNGISI